MTYAPSLPARVRALIGGLVLTAVLSVVIPKIFVEGVMGVRTQPVLVGCLVLVLVAGIVLTVVRVFVTGPVVINTTPTHVELRRGGRIRETWSRRDTQFSSFIVRESTNGIRTGTIRKLIATTAGERVEVVLPWFTKHSYNALIADVAPLVPAVGTAGAALPSAGAPSAGPLPSTATPARPSSGTFTIDDSPIRRGRVVAAVLVVVALLIVGLSLVVPDPMRPSLSSSEVRLCCSSSWRW